MEELARTDPEIFAVIERERQRQLNKLEMIASENFVSGAVLQAQGSILTHKYAEGYPGRRFYGGCEYVDTAENLALNRVKELFGAAYANVQPHSGTQANMAVYFSFLKPGDTILGMDLAHGGHLSHGAPVNFSGRLYHAVTYGVDRRTEEVDFDVVAELARQHRPKMIVAGASAYPRTLDFGRFAEIAREVGAYLMVDMAHIAGLIAAGIHPNPLPVADFVTSTTHKTLRGPRGGLILAQPQYGKALDSQIFPGIQGGPLMHIIAAKAVAFKEAQGPSFRRYQEQIVANARTLAREFIRQGYRLVAGGTDTHLILLDLTPTGLTGRGSGRGPGSGRHHRQQELHPLRPAVAPRHQRHPHRHPGFDYPGHEGAGDGDHRRTHSPGAVCDHGCAPPPEIGRPGKRALPELSAAVFRGMAHGPTGAVLRRPRFLLS